MRHVLTSSVVLSICLSSSALAAVIDFETDPFGGSPVDDAALSVPYNLSGGGTVQFFFDTNGNLTYDSGIDTDPLFEAAGNDANNAFTNNLLGVSDTANGGLAGQLGRFFLRHPVPGPAPPPFVVDYNTSQTITALSGEIWDIDGNQGGTEQWLVKVLDGSNNVLASQLSPLGNNLALDGLPWVFSFTGLPTGVDKLSLTFVGSKTSGIGLAFNNFNPFAVPEPSSVVLMVAGAISIAGARRRHLRRRAKG